jgi:hypothetical protein
MVDASSVEFVIDVLSDWPNPGQQILCCMPVLGVYLFPRICTENNIGALRTPVVVVVMAACD